MTQITSGSYVVGFVWVCALKIHERQRLTNENTRQQTHTKTTHNRLAATSTTRVGSKSRRRRRSRSGQVCCSAAEIPCTSSSRASSCRKGARFFFQSVQFRIISKMKTSINYILKKCLFKSKILAAYRRIVLLRCLA